MKIRNGFVSNSSSSSFIIDANKYSCAQVAEMMIESYFNNEYSAKDKNKSKMLDNLKKLEDKNTSIYMNLYDDEQISKKGDKIYVDATRNMNWLLPCVGYGYEGEFRDLMENDKWFFPEFENKLLGRIPTWTEEERLKKKYKNQNFWRCNSCQNGRYVLLDTGDIMCTQCEKDPDGNNIPVLSREDKLKRILKDEN